MSVAVEAALAGQKIIWGAPVYDQARVAFDETRRAVGDIATPNLSRVTWDFPMTGGQIIFRSLDNPDNVRGHTADGVVIDEAADVSPVAWHESLRPMLIDTGGWAWIIGTPKGLNWFHEGFRNALSRDDSMAMSAPTLGAAIEGGKLVRKPHPLENPNVPWSEVEHLFNTMPERSFRQEILAEFLSSDGAVFRGVDQILIHDTPYPREHAGHLTVAGVDWGQQNDFTAISVFCCTCKREVFLDRFNKIDWHFQRGRLLSIIQDWQVRDTLCEINSIGSPNLEALQREAPIEISGKVKPVIRGFQTTMRSKGDIIRALSLAIEKKTAYFLYDEIAKYELISYEATISEAGNTKYSAVEGSHDDTVIARALALNAAEKYWVIRPTLTEAINKELPATWQDAYLDKLNSQDPVMAQYYYDARRATYEEIKTEKLNKRRPSVDYSGDPDMGAGRDGWSE